MNKGKDFLERMLAFVLYYSGLIRLLRFLGRHDTKILLYHSVDERENDLVRGTSMCVTPDLFEKHIEYVLEHYRVIPLRTLVESLGEENTPVRSCVITFDDGFGDNYRYVFPKLKALHIPASIFLNTDCVQKGSITWLQELCYLVNTEGGKRVFEEIASLTNGNGNGFRTKIHLRGKDLHRYLENYLAYSVDSKQREKILAGLFARMEIDRNRIPGSESIFLDWQMIKEMADFGVTFGNHGRSHSPLSSLSPGEREEDLSESKAILDKYLDTDFIPFAYPFGQHRDIPAGAIELIQRMGHQAALTAMPARNHSGVSPYELGRIPVHNVPVYQLAFELEKETLKKLLRWNSSYGR